MDEIAFTLWSKQQGKTAAMMIKELQTYKYPIYQQEWNNPMGCRNAENRLNDLYRCGCDRCRDEYHRLRYERSRYYDDYNRPSRALSYKAPYMTFDFAADVSTNKEIKMEEPKNYAVKVLVDLLKQQQTYLNSKKTDIDNQKQSIKTIQTAMKGNNTQKLALENKIKELSTALKKLGHKE